MYSRLILSDKPEIIWPLDDLVIGSSSSMPTNFYYTSASSYSASVRSNSSSVIQTPIIFGGGTALRLTSNTTAGLSIPLLNRFSELYGRKQSCLEFWLQCEKMPSQEIKIATKRNNPNIGLYLKENYLMFRYGNSSSYLEVSYGLAELHEPTHIVMNHNKSGIELIVNGVSSITNNDTDIELSSDASHSSNDYLDFYGSSDFEVFIDCPAIYSFNVKSNTAKSHYMYGVARNVKENIFTNLGGEFYNFSTQFSKKSFQTSWIVPTDWTLIEYDNMINDRNGIRVQNNYIPLIRSYDNKITLTNNSISFTSSVGVTTSTYIDVDKVDRILNSGLNPFFVKVMFSGATPTENIPQTIMSYGKKPYQPVLDFNLVNRSGSFYLSIENKEISSSVSFYIPDISSSPTAFLGMSYDNQSKFYFALSGSSIQTASLTNYSGSQFGVDSLSNFFPPTTENIIRIGSALTYDYLSDIEEIGNIRQFTGKFFKFLVAREAFSASTFSQLDGYASPVYSLSYDTDKKRLKNTVYGNANFIIHGSSIAERTNTGSIVITGNRFDFGYPDVLSGSQVFIYVTTYDYANNVVYPKTRLGRSNSLKWLNLENLNNRYLLFDIDILADDSEYYSPVVRYFRSETYPFSGSYVVITDNNGSRIKINHSTTASGSIYTPELDQTPSTLITKESGLRVFNNTIDVEFNPISKSLAVQDLSNLLLYYDTRFPNGIGFSKNSDSASNTIWTSLSGSAIHASVTQVGLNPEYRSQSLNILEINQIDGSESGSVTKFTASGASVTSSLELPSSGLRSIKVTPSGTTADSYMDFRMYTNTSSANRFLFPGQQYTFIGDIGLLKSQTSSAQHANARKIWIGFASATSGGTGLGYLSTVTSDTASNSPGIYTVSAVATVPSGTNFISLRYYNGSSISGDPVYWDNMAIYSGSTISGSTAVFYGPLEYSDDRAVYKFNGLTHQFVSSASSRQPLTIYLVARVFGASGTLIGHSASAPSLYYQSNTFRMGAGQEIIGASLNSNFNIIAGVFNSNSSSLFVNASAVSGNAGTGSYTSAIRIGYRQTPSGANSYLSGDVAAVLVFNTAHTKNEVDNVSNWMRNAFNLD